MRWYGYFLLPCFRKNHDPIPFQIGIIIPEIMPKRKNVENYKGIIDPNQCKPIEPSVVRLWSRSSEGILLLHRFLQ